MKKYGLPLRTKTLPIFHQHASQAVTVIMTLLTCNFSFDKCLRGQDSYDIVDQSHLFFISLNNNTLTLYHNYIRARSESSGESIIRRTMFEWLGLVVVATREPRFNSRQMQRYFLHQKCDCFSLTKNEIPGLPQKGKDILIK